VDNRLTGIVDHGAKQGQSTGRQRALARARPWVAGCHEPPQAPVRRRTGARHTPAAADRVSKIARVTPLLDVSSLSDRRLLLKCENLQPGGAFKIRGAYNMVSQLSPDERRRGVITYSSGNHGQAMALAAAPSSGSM